MRISAKGEYAVKAMLDLSLHWRKVLIPIQGIARRQGIPQRYLEQVLLLLKRSGFLASKRGSSGGYHLVRSPQEITVGEVIRAIEGSLESPVSGRRLGWNRPRGDSGDLQELWRKVSDAISDVLDGMTFAELCERVEERNSAERPMYHI